MTEDGHRQAAEELRARRTLLDRVAGIRAYTELSFAMSHHLVAAGRHRRFSDKHEGLSRWLRDHGAADIADLFAELERMRTGRWYGRKGSGEAADRQDELLDAIAVWSMA